MLEAAPFQHVTPCAKGVCDDDLGARFYVFLMNIPHQLGMG